MTNYVVPPAVTGLNPASGLEFGGTAVTVTGSGFTGATQVSFGTAVVKVTSPVPEGGLQLTVNSPPGSLGTVDVTVTTPAGVSPAVDADKFTYTRFGGIHVESTSKPEAEAPSEPEAEAPSEPEAEAPSEPEAEARSEPEPDAAAATTLIRPAVPAKPVLRLRVTNSADEGRSFDLQPGELTIGREEGSAIQLQGGGVSHNHALLRVRGDNATIEDLRSTNGTKVNGAVIDRQTPLAPGDQIDVGGVQLVVEQHPTAGPDES